MPKKLEYRILPQGEKDDYHSHIRSSAGTSRVTPQYLCVFIVTLGIIILILAGVSLLTASVFYSDQVTKTFGHFWFNYSTPSTSPSSVTTAANETSSSSWQPEHNSRDQDNSSHNANSATNSTSSGNDTSTREPGKILYHHHHHRVFTHGNISGNSSEIDSFGEGNLRNSGNSSESEEHDTDTDMENQQSIDVEDLKEKFAEAMRDLEKRMENITGIRKAEFVIPIFMLMMFLALFSAVSLCCCIMMKRKDKRRRKLFGKLITDLQTGDSKTVLLNNMDLDE